MSFHRGMTAPSSFSSIVCALSLSLALCAGCGDDTSGDAGAFEADAMLPDGATSDAAPSDAGGVDAGNASDCEALAGDNGWDFCSGDATRCNVVFEDGTGCTAACRALGLECEQSYDDDAGMCDYQRGSSAFGCADTGHSSDYCVCSVGSAPDAGAPDAGSDTGGPADGGMPFDTGSGGAHEALLGELVGFGEGTTGGAGGPVILVTNLNDSGAGSLRAAATSTGPAWIRFMVSGVIDLDSNIEMQSDKTIDGRGADVTITGGGLFVQGGAGNVIINNIKMRDAPNDLIRFYDGGSQMWVHHCDLSNGGDGAFDATDGTSMVTISHTHIFDHDKAMLVGAGGDDGDGDGMRWTGHHNWYEDVVQRLPFIRFGRAHSFNNLIEWRSGTAMNVRLGSSQMLVENNILAPQTTVGHKVISESEGRGAVRFTGNLERPLSGDIIEFTEYMPEVVFDASASYDYAAEVANDGLIERLRAQAGWQDVAWPE